MTQGLIFGSVPVWIPLLSISLFNESHQLHQTFSLEKGAGIDINDGTFFRCTGCLLLFVIQGMRHGSALEGTEHQGDARGVHGAVG